MNKKALFSLLLIGVLAFAVTVGTMAWFSAETTVEGNQFVAGTLAIGLGENTVPLEVENMKPSDVVEHSVTIVNDGSIDMKFKAMVKGDTVDHKENSNADIAEVLDVVVKMGTHTAYTGTLRNLIDNPDDMLKWEPGVGVNPLGEGEEVEFNFTVTFNEEAGNDYQNCEFNNGAITFYATQWTNTGWNE
ncbi:MAG: hypothetical protein JJT76_10350 [Clostridiaceae bacterium]|nr:hypothetical protein [Clostridiaceae bacterium]